MSVNRISASHAPLSLHALASPPPPPPATETTTPLPLLLLHSKHVQRILLPTGQLKYAFARCLIAEFMGTLLFQIFGGAAPPKDTTAPAANGFALVAVIAAFAGISGAHLNPAVTFALTCTGHMVVWKGLCYAVAQVRDEMMRERGEGRRRRAAQGPPK